MPALTKCRTVLMFRGPFWTEGSGEHTEADIMQFVAERDDDDDDDYLPPVQTVLLRRALYDDLGQPETITVSIEPGDHLNDLPPTFEDDDEMERQSHKP